MSMQFLAWINELRQELAEVRIELSQARQDISELRCRLDAPQTAQAERDGAVKGTLTLRKPAA